MKQLSSKRIAEYKKLAQIKSPLPGFVCVGRSGSLNTILDELQLDYNKDLFGFKAKQNGVTFHYYVRQSKWNELFGGK